MPTEIYLVKVGMNMTEGVVEEWYVPDGGNVEKGELLYRLETEKVNLDVDAEVSGTVRRGRVCVCARRSRPGPVIRARPSGCRSRTRNVGRGTRRPDPELRSGNR